MPVFFSCDMIATASLNKCVSKTHIRQRGGGVQLKLCVTPPPLFTGNISVADYMPLYLIYSKLLKLMAASNAGCAWNIRDSRRMSGRSLLHGWSRVITIWTVYYSLSHVSRRPCKRNKHPLPCTHRWTIVYDASHRSYVEDRIVQKNIFDPRLETTKDIAKRNPCKFSRRSARDICIYPVPAQKYI